MSWVEDGRKLVQDFLTPELRAIVVRLDSLEKIVEANEARAEKRFQSLEAHIDKQFQNSQTRLDKRFQATETQFEKRFQTSESQFDKRLQLSDSQMEKRFQLSESHMEKRFQVLHGSMQDIDARSEKRHGEVLAALDKLTDYQVILARLARLEEKVVQPTH